MANGRTPPWWAAGLTLGLGIASFRHGLKPPSATKIRGPMTIGLIVAYVAAIIFYAVWLPSTEMILRRPSTASADPGVTPSPASKSGGPLSTPHKASPAPTIVTVDESGQANGEVSRIWMDVRSGKNYRTRTIGDTLFLEAIDTVGKSPAGIVHCDFHHAGQEWTGKCSERLDTDPGVHYTQGTVTSLSNTRLEGHTNDIQEFLMVPVETVDAEGQTSASGNSVFPEPDLSGLSDADKKSIETTCASDKLLQGPIEYNHCVSKQVDALRNAPKPPDLSHLTARERDSIQLVCSNSKLMAGPIAYNQCLIRQLDLMKKPPR
jgi:hypothetical protein